MADKVKKQRGDRWDGVRVRKDDPMHMFMPYLMGERADNEAFMYETFDLTAVKEYMEAKNAQNPEHKYTVFHIIMAALGKTIYMRPKLNRFILNRKYYDRTNISFALTAKRRFADGADESLVKVIVRDDDTPLAQQVHETLCGEVYKIKEEKGGAGEQDGATDIMSVLTKIPGPILKLVTKIIFWLEHRGWLPKDFNEVNPYNATIFISNLGSIKMNAMYHHLINFSEGSIFVVVNRAKMNPFFHDDGTYEMKYSVPISFTLDERIADGFYFARSLMLFKFLLEHPQLLDEPLSSPVDYDEQRDS